MHTFKMNGKSLKIPDNTTLLEIIETLEFYVYNMSDVSIKHMEVQLDYPVDMEILNNRGILLTA